MKVTVEAPEGVFPAGATLSVSAVDADGQRLADAAVAAERDADRNIAASYTFDITILDTKFITGGTFSDEPDATYIADGYKAVPRGEKYIVIPNDKNSYEVMYDANNGTGDQKLDPSTNTEGERYTVWSNPFTTPEGKVFSCWNTRSDGEGDDYDADQVVPDGLPVTKDNERIRLFAQWEPGTCTVTFHANYGGDAADVTAIQTFARTGYTLLGWATNHNAAKPTYATNEKVMFTEKADIKLYAIWGANDYNISFTSDDDIGTVVKSERMAFGAQPACDAPVKAADGQYIYTFIGWKCTEYTPAKAASGAETDITGIVEVGKVYTGKLPVVTGSLTYRAEYRRTARVFTVTWVDHDGTVVEVDSQQAYGGQPAFGGQIAGSHEDERFTYAWKGAWADVNGTTYRTEALLPGVAGDVTYTAVYEAAPRSFRVTFLGDDGNTLSTEQLAYGATPVYHGGTPTKACDACYDYRFTGWDRALAPVTGDATYKARFAAQARVYTVTWIIGDNRVDA